MSLTDGVGPHGQIRYNLHRRSRRALAEIAELLRRAVGEATLCLCCRQEPDPGSLYFLDVASRLWPDLSVCVESCGLESTCPGWVEDGCVADEPRVALSEAWAYLRAGDPWGCQRSLARLDPGDLGPRGNQAMATALVALDRPEEAEAYFLAWIGTADLLGAARAKYGLALLYARFHASNRRSDSRAAAILDSALSDLAEARAVDVDLDTTFEEVFNRNGYALLEFRQGCIQSTLDLLQSGLARLPDTSERNHLHRSVLLYNMAQVYRRVGRHADAVRVYEQVLALDPYMPEYHCELAMSLASLGRESEALAAVQVALFLDPYIPESHALLGYILTRCDRTVEAASSYGRAYELTGTLRSAYEYAFAAAAIGDHSRVLDILGQWDILELSPVEASNLSALKAEALVGLGLYGEAIAGLRMVLGRFPENGRVARNLATLVRLKPARRTQP